MNKFIAYLLLSPLIFFVVASFIFFISGNEEDRVKTGQALLWGIILLLAFWGFYFI